MTNKVLSYSLFTDADIEQFQGGTHNKLYNLFGNKSLLLADGTEGIYFSVWAPHAQFVSVIGFFNEWDEVAHPLYKREDNSGIWEGLILHLHNGEAYKYYIKNNDGHVVYKADPYAHLFQMRPLNNSVTWGTFYDWRDDEWVRSRKLKNSLASPLSIYEVHLPSWRKPSDLDSSFYNYRALAEPLIDYIQKMGFTHIELLPIMEHPYDDSWGYQCTGYFAPTSRMGGPQDFAFFVDSCHRAGIGVILDWVPAHFPKDEHGLYQFDGSVCYEYQDHQKANHPSWGTCVFDYASPQVASFLLSSAYFWFDRFHIDGLRVDAVSSMLHLDYCRPHGSWKPNIHGGNGNLEAIAFIKKLNNLVHEQLPDVQMIAEEATDWPHISLPVTEGGLGFNMKWMMGWMHDTLRYFKRDPIFRQYHQSEFSFSMMYFYNEHFILPLSHDEVVHGKSPMIYKMVGDEWQKFANLRLLYTYLFTHPGAKLLFMGNEFASTNEWDAKRQLPWHLINHLSHGGIQYCVQELNRLYRSLTALHAYQYKKEGFEWVDLDHPQDNVIVYLRKTNNTRDYVLVILNTSPLEKRNWVLYVTTTKHEWREIFNSDSKEYWGTGDFMNTKPIYAEPINKEKSICKLVCNIPPLGGIILY